MPTKTYHVFISHSWDHSEDLKRLRELLEARPYFKVEFEEVPKHEPINSANAPYIKRRLRDRLKSSDIVLVIAGVYATYSNWMQWELDTADECGLSVVGVIPRGQERISTFVKDSAIEFVYWNTESIVDAIRRHAK